jgi:hypothetical protein
MEAVTDKGIWIVQPARWDKNRTCYELLFQHGGRGSHNHLFTTETEALGREIAEFCDERIVKTK